MANVSISVHMSDDLSTAHCSLSGVKMLDMAPQRVIAFVDIGDVSLYFESTAQLDEVIEVLGQARNRFEALKAGVA